MLPILLGCTLHLGAWIEPRTLLLQPLSMENSVPPFFLTPAKRSRGRSQIRCGEQLSTQFEYPRFRHPPPSTNFNGEFS